MDKELAAPQVDAFSMAMGCITGDKKEVSYLDLISNQEKMKHYIKLYETEIFRLWVDHGHHVDAWLTNVFGFICHVDAAWNLGLVRSIFVFRKYSKKNILRRRGK